MKLQQHTQGIDLIELIAFKKHYEVQQINIGDRLLELSALGRHRPSDILPVLSGMYRRGRNNDDPIQHTPDHT